MLAAASGQQEALALKSRQAKELMAAGRYAEAIPLYQELVRAVPGNPGLILNLGLAEHMAGEHRQAIPHFEAVLKAMPDNLPALLSLGASHLELGEPAAAIAPLQKALAAEPENRETRGMLAQALLAAGRPREAAAAFQKLTALAPGDPKAWYGLGKSYEAAATAAFEQLTRTAPESEWTLALVADSRVQTRQYRSAFLLYREALAKNPAMPGVHRAIAEVYRKTGHADWAEQEQRLEPAKPAPLNPLYRDAASFNRSAVEAFSRLGALPESVELHRLRAETMRAHGQHLESIKEWRAALALEPGNTSLEREIAVSLYLGADYAQAAPLLLRFRPMTPDVNYMEGDSLLHLERPAEAVRYLEAAVRADPKMLAARASLGLTYAKLGQAAKAIPHLEAAAAIDEDGSVTYQLARALQAAGQAVRARQALEKYQAILKKTESQKEEIAREAQITAPAR